MKTYELTYIISPEITSEEAIAKGKEIESAIQSREGTVIKQTAPIARTLSYPIKKHASGFFGTVELQLEPEKLVELKEVLAKDGNIVRYMVIIKEAIELRKERRTRTKPAPEQTTQKKSEDYTIETKKDEELSSAKLEEKQKVELKDIEEKLDEILGE
jgi:ribosomal protein S6